MRILILICRLKAGHKIYGVEILRGKESNKAFKETFPFDLVFLQKTNSRFRNTRDNDQKSVTWR